MLDEQKNKLVFGSGKYQEIVSGVVRAHLSKSFALLVDANVAQNVCCSHGYMVEFDLY